MAGEPGLGEGMLEAKAGVGGGKNESDMAGTRAIGSVRFVVVAGIAAEPAPSDDDAPLSISARESESCLLPLARRSFKSR